MSVNYSLPAHANGFTSEGSVNEDRLFDNFTVRKVVAMAPGGGAPGNEPNLYVRGMALGKVTASRKWTLSNAAATDGSQIIRGIMLHDVDATAGVEALIGRRGSCNPEAVIFGAGHTLASVEDACLDRGIVFTKVLG